MITISISFEEHEIDAENKHMLARLRIFQFGLWYNFDIELSTYFSSGEQSKKIMAILNIRF